MTIIRCPRCRDEVTAPAKASHQAVVRCPLCLEEYPLSEALRHAPPELIVIGGASESEPAYAAASAAPDYQLAGSGGMFDASPGAGVATPLAPIAKGTRPRRKQGGGIGTFVGIVFGGVAGISLAVLLLWWVFQRDIGFGPTVAKYKYFRWIVPAQFREEAGTPQSSGSPQSAQAEQTSAFPSRPRMASAPQRGPAPEPAGGSGDLQTAVPGLLPDPGVANPVSPTGGITIDSPLDSPKPLIANGLLDPGAPLPLPPAGSSPPGKAATPDLTALIPANTPAAPAVPPPGAAAPPTADDFKQSVVAAIDALVRYDESPPSDAEGRKARFTDMYLAAGEMGRTISYFSLLDPDVEGMVKEMQLLLSKLAGVGGPNRLSGVRFLTATHWRERKHSEGLLVAGLVKEFKAVGPLFEIALDATRDTPLTIPIVSDKNPQDFCQLEDELAVVGRIIDDPKTNLPGYEGTQPRILMLGYCVKAPKGQ